MPPANCGATGSYSDLAIWCREVLSPQDGHFAAIFWTVYFGQPGSHQTSAILTIKPLSGKRRLVVKGMKATVSDWKYLANGLKVLVGINPLKRFKFCIEDPE